MTDQSRAVEPPKRIQRKRTKGWKMPPNAVYVGRPTKWGNHWKLGESKGFGKYSAEDLVKMFRMHQADDFSSRELNELRGKDLACWCRLDQPCHADVLLEIANGK